jgi:hypothetical protein
VLTKLCADVLHYEINCHMIVSFVQWMDDGMDGWTDGWMDESCWNLLAWLIFMHVEEIMALVISSL